MTIDGCGFMSAYSITLLTYIAPVDVVVVFWQVCSLGCKYFALLFDDIDDDLCPEDLSQFSSPAEAQCSVTNAMFDYLKQPDIFLFCPTGLSCLIH